MTSALHAEGPRFDPGLVYFLQQGRARAGGVRARAAGRQTSASIAQMVERKTLNLVVEGSSPSVGKLLYFFCAWDMGIFRIPSHSTKKLSVISGTALPGWMAERSKALV